MVIHRDAVIEAACLILQRAALCHDKTRHVPHVGQGVYIGGGANILAGDRIGANAGLRADVPAGRTAVGISARLASRLSPHPPAAACPHRRIPAATAQSRSSSLIAVLPRVRASTRLTITAQ